MTIFHYRRIKLSLTVNDYGFKPGWVFRIRRYGRPDLYWALSVNLLGLRFVCCKFAP